MKNFYAAFFLSFLLFSCTTKKLRPQNPELHNLASIQSENLDDKESALDENDLVNFILSKDFIQGSEDIPLLAEMEKMFDESMAFDSASGSIMSSSYQSKIGLKKIRNFYTKTLPQMGWKLVKTEAAKSFFKREKEKLEIEFIVQNKEQIVRFFISSAL